ncbi:hypothetical protein A4R44_05145 [Amycolatopsis sp. M39]|nr:hypothetical protein A4R44_05145 [Amycolatopsis sp. M39]
MGALPTEAMDAIAEGITGRVPVSTFIAAGCGKPAR